MTVKWSIELLTPRHDRRAFTCGDAALDEFLKRYARQNAEKDVSRTYVAVMPPDPSVVGYYTICSGSIEFEDMPREARKGLPKYAVPTAHLARLAVDRRHQGAGLGGVLLLDALKRVERLADQMGIHAVTVIALNESVRAFYQRFEFQPLLDDDLHLFMLIATVRQISP
jgi:GNAT superfamily N-acetyltransferase